MSNTRNHEDQVDNEAAEAALLEPGESIPWEQVKVLLGLVGQ